MNKIDRRSAFGNRVGSGFGGHDEASRRSNHHGLQGHDAVARCRGACLRWRDTIHRDRGRANLSAHDARMPSSVAWISSMITRRERGRYDRTEQAALTRNSTLQAPNRAAVSEASSGRGREFDEGAHSRLGPSHTQGVDRCSSPSVPNSRMREFGLGRGASRHSPSFVGARGTVARRDIIWKAVSN